MRNVVFIAPFPVETTMRFVRAASALDGVRLLGVVHTPPSGGDAACYHDHVRVTNPLSEDDIFEGCDVLARRHGPLDRIICILEPLQVTVAKARERHGVAGTTVRTADLFRDKPRMKEALAAAGLPVARHRLASSVTEAREFAEEVGFPLVLKPPAGMGAKVTFRVSDGGALTRALQGLRVSAADPMLCEELLEGREYSLETVTTGGVPRAFSASHYLPTCLQVLENDWIQWCCLLPRDISGPPFDAARELATRAIAALGLESGMTHMEWFERADGSLAIGEIGCRPPGANISLMTGLAHDLSAYRAWARAEVDGELDAPWERTHAVGCAFLRGMGRGRVAAVTGVRETHAAIGSLIAEAKLPTIGAPRSAHYEGDGYIVVKHPETAPVEAALNTIINTIRVHYG